RRRPRARVRAGGAPDGRTARRARQESPGAPPARAQAPPAAARGHGGLRDARPGRGAHDVRPDRGHAPRRGRAGRDAPRALRGAGDELRRRLRRREHEPGRHLRPGGRGLQRGPPGRRADRPLPSGGPGSRGGLPPEPPAGARAPRGRRPRGRPSRPGGRGGPRGGCHPVLDRRGRARAVPGEAPERSAGGSAPAGRRGRDRLAPRGLQGLPERGVMAGGSGPAAARLSRRGGALGRWGGLSVPALGFVALVYLVPLGSMLVDSVLSPEPGLQNFARLLGSWSYQRVLLQTLWIALVATVLCLVIGYPVAFAITRAGPVARRGLIIGIISPYLTSVLVRTFAWEVLLGRLGLITRTLRLLGVPTEGILLTPAAVIVGLVHVLLPLMILPLYSVMQGIDESLPRSARALGAGPARAFFRVYLPLTLPGVEVGCVLVFVYGVGAFITPQILGGRSGIMLGVVIQVAIDQLADLGFAAAAACLLTVIVLTVLVLYRAGMSGSIEWLAVRESIGRVGREPRRRRRSGRTRILVRLGDLAGRGLDATGLSRRPGLLWAFTGAVLAFLVLPQLIAVPISFSSTRTLIFPPRSFSPQWYVNFFSADWLAPAITSTVVATTVAVAATLLGALAGVGVVRGL